MKCTECGHSLTKSVSDHKYLESGMDHVVLRNVPHYDCAKCGHHSVVIERMAQLHRLLAHIIATKPARLIPSEVRFIRDHLELTNRDFAIVMGVSETQASRWTSSEPIGVPAERFLRMLATIGPIVVTQAPRVELGVVSETELVADMRATLGSLPSKDEPARELPVRIRRTASDWKQEQSAST